jgi:uncharacterized protein YbjT (DUF2867 family)
VSQPLILVTGATGQVGGEVARQLLQQGERVRVLARDPAKAAQVAPSAEIVQADLEHPETLGPAFEGADRVFVVSNYPRIAVLEANAYAAAKAAGVQHIVKLSGRHVNSDFMAGTPLAAWHSDSEQRLQSLGIPWTILRPGSFSSNFLLWLDRKAGAVFLPAGEGRDSFIDPRDIAACAVKALTTPGHDGRIYEITGAEHLTYAEWAARLSAAIGRTIAYQDIPPQVMREGMLSMGLEEATADSFLAFFGGLRAGKMYPPTSAVFGLLGRPPIALEAWAKENAAALRSQS